MLSEMKDIATKQTAKGPTESKKVLKGGVHERREQRAINRKDLKKRAFAPYGTNTL